MKSYMESYLARATLAMSILATALGVASAQQNEVRRITQTEATSKCIGDPKTPLCAVETLLTCMTRPLVSG